MILVPISIIKCWATSEKIHYVGRLPITSARVL